MGFGMSSLWTFNSTFSNAPPSLQQVDAISRQAYIRNGRDLEDTKQSKSQCQRELEEFKSKNIYLEQYIQQLEKEQQVIKNALNDEKNETSKEWKNDELTKTSSSVGGGGGIPRVEEQQQPRFDESTGYAHGMVRMDKSEFVSVFDYGTPTDGVPNNEGSHDVLLLYNTKAALPNNPDLANAAQHYSTSTMSGNNGGGKEEKNKHGGRGEDAVPMMDVGNATENCAYLTVATVPSLTTLEKKNKGFGQCMAIIRNYDNWHLQKWVRIPLERQSKNKEEVELKASMINASLPLRSVSRMHSVYSSDVVEEDNLPTARHSFKHWKRLNRYFENLEQVLKELGPIAKRVAGAVENNNAIIVMTCNFGQSELLINFVCNARAKGLSLDSILVFPTDEKTHELAQALGLATFYDTYVSFWYLVDKYIYSFILYIGAINSGGKLILLKLFLFLRLSIRT